MSLTPLTPLTPAFPATRSAVQRVAVHVLARTRHAAVGRIDLAPTPGGIGTPAFGADHRVIRLAGDRLVVDTTTEQATTRSIAVPGSSLAALAAFAGADLTAEFSAGHDTPPLGDLDEPMAIDGRAVVQLGEWFRFGARVIDVVVGERPADSAPSRARIWPEHFDLGIDLGAANGRRLNLGASPGDSFHDAPYLYVAPWDDDRPGDPAYWNAPFGAVVGYAELLGSPEPGDAGALFMGEGIDRFG